MPRFGFPDVLDGVSVRVVAALVLGIALVALVAGRWWLYAVLAADFMLRAAYGPSLSPLSQIAVRWLRPRFGALPRPTAGAPKRFAAMLAALLTAGAFLMGVVASMGGSPAATTVLFALGTIMIVFSALEAFAGFCAGCLFYSRLIRVGLVPPQPCLDCMS